MPTPKSNQQRTGSRVRPHEMDDAVYRPHGGVENLDQTDQDWGSSPRRDVRTYTLFGKHDFLSDDEEPLLFEETDKLAYAKKVWINNGHPKYYIRRTTEGTLYNPIGLDPETQHNKTIHHAVRTDSDFVPVNKKVFELYIQFLKTKNPGFLRSAQRETF